MAIIIRTLVKRAGRTIVRVVDQAAGNFAKVRGADLLNGTVPNWLRRVFQLVAPSTLVTGLPLPFAFLFDVSTYAVFDDVLKGGGPVLDLYQQLLIDLNSEARDFILLGQADELARIFNESVQFLPDGSMIVQVPKLWFRDP